MKKILYGLLTFCFLLTSCKKDNSDNSSTSQTEKDIVREIVASLNNFSERLNEFDKGVSAKTYTINQTDNYYGIDVESIQSGTYQKYNDDFMTNIFEQNIGDSSVLGKEETGILTDRIYEISYFGENDSSNCVIYYPNTDSNHDAIFNLDFASEYINSIINVTLSYYRLNAYKYSLTTNFDTVNLSEDGEVTIQYRFIVYEKAGMGIIEEVQRDDKITILDNKITSCETTMLYSMQDGINFKYMEKTQQYAYNELTDYDGEKLNPADFKEYSPTQTM